LARGFAYQSLQLDHQFFRGHGSVWKCQHCSIVRNCEACPNASVIDSNPTWHTASYIAVAAPPIFASWDERERFCSSKPPSLEMRFWRLPCGRVGMRDIRRMSCTFACAQAINRCSEIILFWRVCMYGKSRVEFCCDTPDCCHWGCTCERCNSM